jgi:hypothetical protein
LVKLRRYRFPGGFDAECPLLLTVPQDGVVMKASGILSGLLIAALLAAAAHALVRQGQTACLIAGSCHIESEAADAPLADNVVRP